MSEDERDLLGLIALRPNGVALRGEEMKRLVAGLTMRGYVSDVYETAGGALTARITLGGRLALEEPA